MFLGGGVGFQEISFFPRDSAKADKANMASLLESGASCFASAAGVDDEDDDGSALFQPSKDDVTNIDDQLASKADDDTEEEDDDKSIRKATVKINNLEKSAQSLENWLEKMAS